MIYRIQRYCVHDGRGIRTTVFFKGCQIRCPWCANPESQNKEFQIGYYEEKCIHCKVCEKICPVDAIAEGKIKKELCISCEKCIQECPTEALTGFGQEMSAEKIADEVCKDLPFYRKSKGGATFSGGEATMQPELLFNVMKILKRRGVHIALESHGIFSGEICEQLLEYVDQFLIDLKHMNEEEHKKMLGVSNQQVLCNMRKLAKKDLTIRIPLIPGFNDTDENLIQSAEFAKGLGVRIDLLPFHNYGTSKYNALGMNYEYENTPVYSEAELKRCMEIIRSRGVLAE
ncbi:MAG: glycyl-radical enzyme activating protein [Schaedlerella sp.]|nr:glycyl-radical enzyme activating protein [Schaedlerella sp.]